MVLADGAVLPELVAALVALRRAAYRNGWFGSVRVSRPVVVVGNITVGGTGKTPMTIWLAEQLHARGLRVGIVLRGYGGESTHWPRDVTKETPSHEVGDEAVLLAQRTGALVVAEATARQHPGTVAVAEGGASVGDAHQGARCAPSSPAATRRSIARRRCESAPDNIFTFP